MIKKLLGNIAFAFVSLISVVALAQPEKEWTVLVYLNGHNNLDSFGAMNVDQMAQAGSTDNVNIVVQWASQDFGKTRRILVKKGGFDVIEEMSPIDMGDYHSLVEFVQWAQARYPAKKYMVDVWNHGNGWHLMNVAAGIHTNDISWDDISGNHITTEQLGVAMGDIAKVLGHKTELFATDACLMAMAEVANEMTNSVKFYAGSEEVEPGEGWPYGPFLSRLIANPSMDGAGLGAALAIEYKKAYSGGVYGHKDVTYSAYDLREMGNLNQAIRTLAGELKSLDASSLKVAFQSINKTQDFYNADYKDFGDYLKVLETAKVRISPSTISSVRSAMKSFVISNEVTSGFVKATGLAVWLPGNAATFNSYSARYMKLQFNMETGWGEFLASAIKSGAAVQ